MPWPWTDHGLTVATAVPSHRATCEWEWESRVHFGFFVQSSLSGLTSTLGSAPPALHSHQLGDAGMLRLVEGDGQGTAPIVAAPHVLWLTGLGLQLLAVWMNPNHNSSLQLLGLEGIPVPGCPLWVPSWHRGSRQPALGANPGCKPWVLLCPCCVAFCECCLTLRALRNCLCTLGAFPAPWLEPLPQPRSQRQREQGGISGSEGAPRLWLFGSSPILPFLV